MGHYKHEYVQEIVQRFAFDSVVISNTLCSCFKKRLTRLN